MKYVLLLMGDTAGPRCGTENAPGVEDFVAFDAELKAAGVLVGGFALEDPETGSSVHVPAGESDAVVTAGPFAESREFVGGTVILDVPTIDEALAWAKKCPGARDGRVEVRALAEY